MRGKVELESSLLAMGFSLDFIDDLDLEGIESPWINKAVYWKETKQGWDFWNDLWMKQMRWMEYDAPKEFWVTRLFLYCHDLDCSHPFECPEEHRECYRRLGLDTAIAWKLATWCDGGKATPETLAKIEFVRSMVDLHYEKYPILSYLVAGLYHAVLRETRNV